MALQDKEATYQQMFKAFTRAFTGDLLIDTAGWEFTSQLINFGFIDHHFVMLHDGAASVITISELYNVSLCITFPTCFLRALL